MSHAVPVKDPNLRRYWFEFDGQGLSSPVKIGCGVTAYDEKDALALIETRIFAGHSLPQVCKTMADIDIRTLDQNHVAPNMGPVVFRGIWFPLGYQDDMHNG